MGEFAHPVEMRPDGVAVGAMKFSVDVQESFDVVVAGRKILQAGERIAGRMGINDGVLPRLKLGDVFSEKWRSAFGQKLNAGLDLVGLGDDHEYAAGDRLRLNGCWERDSELMRGLRAGGGRRQEGKQDERAGGKGRYRTERRNSARMILIVTPTADYVDFAVSIHRLTLSARTHPVHLFHNGQSESAKAIPTRALL